MERHRQPWPFKTALELPMEQLLLFQGKKRDAKQARKQVFVQGIRVEPEFVSRHDPKNEVAAFKYQKRHLDSQDFKLEKVENEDDFVHLFVSPYFKDTPNRCRALLLGNMWAQRHGCWLHEHFDAVDAKLPGEEFGFRDYYSFALVEERTSNKFLSISSVMETLLFAGHVCLLVNKDDEPYYDLSLKSIGINHAVKVYIETAKQITALYLLKQTTARIYGQLPFE